MFSFQTPEADAPAKPSVSSTLNAINYDRSPSLVATEERPPDTPVTPRQFTSFDEAKQAFDAWLPSCNWLKPATLKRFWYESEKHLSPDRDFVAWSFHRHPLWQPTTNGDILPRAGVEVTIPTQDLPADAKVSSSQPSMLAKAVAAAESRLNQSHANVVASLSETLGESVSSVVESIETTNGTTTVTTTFDSLTAPEEQSTTYSDASPAKKYTAEEYADMCRIAEENFAVEVQRRESLYTELSMERAKREDEVKSLKADERASLESLRMFKLNGPHYPKNPELNSEGSQEGESPAAAESSPLDVSPERWERYLDLPLLPITRDVKGLGSSKLTTLTDQCPTVRKLTELQKEHGQFWFKHIGKGFGPELGSRIEDAVTNALASVQ